MLKDSVWGGNEIAIIIISNYLVPQAPCLSQVFLLGEKLLCVHKRKASCIAC